MRTAATVLSIIHERGKRGLPLEDLYRQLYNPDLYLRAYARLYHHDGALTPGATEETADGMTLAKIDRIITLLRQERYHWTPVRRTYVPKKNGKQRPLGLPTWSDKLRGILRAAIQRPLLGFPSPSRVPYRPQHDQTHVEWDTMVHRGRYHALLR